MPKAGALVSDSYILIVEDDEDIRENMVTLLEDEGYRAFSAKNGKEAIDFIIETSLPMPRLIALDLYMPVMDGKAFLAALEQNRPAAKFGRLPVILLTASGEHEREGLENETFGILRKPIDIDEFLGIVKRYAG